MTNEEAIKILCHTTNLGYGIIIEEMEGYTTRDIKIALDMAIKSLEEKRPQGECKSCGLGRLIAVLVDNGTIKREQAVWILRGEEE